MTTDGGGHAGEPTGFSNYSIDPQRSGVDEWHLYANGVDLPPNSLVGVPGVLPYFELPAAQPTSYRLTEHFQNWLGGYGSRSDTTWLFSSRAATGKELAPEYDSLGLCTVGCRVEPLLFLRYRFDLRLDNRSVAPGTHTFTVTAYHQPSTAAMPSVAGLTMSVSLDGGQHWSQLPVKAMGDGTYRVTVVQPKLTGQSGTVSLRTEAWDRAGNRIAQTLYDAYGLVSDRR